MDIRETKQLPNGDLCFADTGELIDRSKGTLVYFPHKMKIKGWFMAFQVAFKELAKDRDLRGVPGSVLNYLLSILEFENDLKITQVEIAKDLGIGRDQVSKAIKTLLDKGIIAKGPKLGCSWAYRLNYQYAWKGKVKNLDKRKREQ